jgi:hypothetical protein
VKIAKLSICNLKILEGKPEKGNWTKAHLSPKRLSGRFMANGLSNDKSGLNPFWNPGCCEYTVSYLSSSHRSNDMHCIIERSNKEFVLEG